MSNSKFVHQELAKLKKQYGDKRVSRWVAVSDYAVNEGFYKAYLDKLPKATMSGKELAGTLVKAGLDKDNTFYLGYMLDKTVTHKIYLAVMDDIDKKKDMGPSSVTDYHLITNQVMVDLAHWLGMDQVKLPIARSAW